MSLFYRVIFVIAFTLFTSLMLHAGGKNTFEFLRYDVGARAAALGGSFVTMNNDPNSIFYNPASLATLETSRLSIGFFKHLMDINAGHASFGTNIPSLGSVGAGIMYVNYGEFRMTDENAQDLGTFNAGELALVGNFADKLENGLEYGINAKFIFSSIAEYNSSAAALDAGLRYTLPNGLVLGTSISNIGTQFDPYINTRESLPLDLKIGAAIYPEHLPAVLFIGFNKLNEEQDKFFERFSAFAVGVEFTASSHVALRFGYNNERRRELKIGNSSGLAGFSLGAGFTSSIYTIDYAFSSLGKVGALHRVSIGLGL